MSGHYAAKNRSSCCCINKRNSCATVTTNRSTSSLLTLCGTDGHLAEASTENCEPQRALVSSRSHAPPVITALFTICGRPFADLLHEVFATRCSEPALAWKELVAFHLFEANLHRVWPGGRTRCQATCSTTGIALRPGARTEALAITGTFHLGVPMKTQLQRSRQIAFDRQGGKCYYCGLRMWLYAPGGPSPLRCTAEHLLARSEGGGDGTSNIVAACLHCNRTRHKRKRPPEPMSYRSEVRRRVEQGAWLPAQVLKWGVAGCHER